MSHSDRCARCGEPRRNHADPMLLCPAFTFVAPSPPETPRFRERCEHFGLHAPMGPAHPCAHCHSPRCWGCGPRPLDAFLGPDNVRRDPDPEPSSPASAPRETSARCPKCKDPGCHYMAHGYCKTYGYEPAPSPDSDPEEILP